MKIIAKVTNDRYVCEVSHSELEKFLGLYYGHLGNLTVGDEVDLGKGYDFAVEARAALQKTEDFISSNKEIIVAILSGITVVGALGEYEDKGNNHAYTSPSH